jgi:hypothetical protein
VLRVRFEGLEEEAAMSFTFVWMPEMFACVECHTPCTAEEGAVLAPVCWECATDEDREHRRRWRAWRSDA